MGSHSFRYGLYLHNGSFAGDDVTRAGAAFNVPLDATPFINGIEDACLFVYFVCLCGVAALSSPPPKTGDAMFV